MNSINSTSSNDIKISNEVDAPRKQVTVDKTGLLQLKVDDKVIKSYKISIIQGTEKVSISDDAMKQIAAKVADIFNKNLADLDLTDLSMFKISNDTIMQSINGETSVKAKLSTTDSNDLKSIIDRSLLKKEPPKIKKSDISEAQVLHPEVKNKESLESFKGSAQVDVKHFKQRIETFSSFIKWDLGDPSKKAQIEEKISDVGKKITSLEDMVKLDSKFDSVAIATLKDSIASDMRDIKANLSIQKTTTVAQDTFSKIAKGKAKQVWSSKAEPTNVYFTPVKSSFESVFKTKEAEIREEGRTVDTISKNLLKNSLETFLTKSFQSDDLTNACRYPQVSSKYLSLQFVPL